MPGVATGLAWTPVGGDILFIEASKVPGSGKLILTGQLGDVMKESAQAALDPCQEAYFGESLEKIDIHIHVPAGATPKDGPRAGVAMFLALMSLLTDKPVRADVAMTGEISLRGLVLPIGGVKEKTLAALRAGIKTVMLPRRNEKDLEDVPAEARAKLEFVFLDRVEDAIRTAIGELPARSGRRLSVGPGTRSRIARTARRFASRRVRSHLPASDAWIQIGGCAKLGLLLRPVGGTCARKPTASPAGMPSPNILLHPACGDFRKINRMLQRRSSCYPTALLAGCADQPADRPQPVHAGLRAARR